jgi:serine/threonine protein kinase
MTLVMLPHRQKNAMAETMMGAPQFAVKVTPLYTHHTLIATRLLREPTILAQLPLHPNLVRVYESIRTPGYFYLIGETRHGIYDML